MMYYYIKEKDHKFINIIPKFINIERKQLKFINSVDDLRGHDLIRLIHISNDLKEIKIEILDRNDIIQYIINEKIE